MFYVKITTKFVLRSAQKLLNQKYNFSLWFGNVKLLFATLNIFEKNVNLELRNI